MKTGIELIAIERQRQIDKEGWSLGHDKANHKRDELARAGATYAMPFRFRELLKNGKPKLFPFGVTSWKPSPRPLTMEGRRKELIKAGALIAAEIDRLQNS